MVAASHSFGNERADWCLTRKQPRWMSASSIRLPTTRSHRGDNINVVIARGYEETAVALSAVDATNGAASHFRGRALFLEDAVQFDARASPCRLMGSSAPAISIRG